MKRLLSCWHHFRMRNHTLSSSNVGGSGRAANERKKNDERTTMTTNCSNVTSSVQQYLLCLSCNCFHVMWFSLVDDALPLEMYRASKVPLRFIIQTCSCTFSFLFSFSHCSSNIHHCTQYSTENFILSPESIYISLSLFLLCVYKTVCHHFATTVTRNGTTRIKNVKWLHHYKPCSSHDWMSFARSIWHYHFHWKILTDGTQSQV